MCSGYVDVLHFTQRHSPVRRRGRALAEQASDHTGDCHRLRRRSGLPHVVLLAYRREKGWYVVDAGDRRPGWFGNLVADPEVRVQIRRAVFGATATGDPEGSTMRLERRPGADPIPGDRRPLPRACGLRR